MSGRIWVVHLGPPLVLPGFLLALVLGEIGEWIARRYVSRNLAALLPPRRLDIPKPLREGFCDQTRRLVRPFLRNLERATELVPGTAPCGGRNEPASTE